MSIAHERQRQALSLLMKKIRFAPIVSIQGPRQCGKSYFASKILPQHLKSIEIKTLDHRESIVLADQNPHYFLTSTDKKHFVIDEVQKVPHLFDEMKALVDEKRSPGQFIILGSTEFSIEAKIKESLTGRLSRIKMYPFNLSETQKLPINPTKIFPYIQNKSRVSRKDVQRYFKNGGLPGIFIVKSELEKMNLIKDWIGLTTSRDIFQFKEKRLDPNVAENILNQIAKLDLPTAGSIAEALGLSLVNTRKYLKVLKQLFVIDEVVPANKSAGKSKFYLCDVGLLSYYEASLAKLVETWLLLEFRSQMSYKGELHDNLSFFKSARSQSIQFIQTHGQMMTSVRVIAAESVTKRDVLVFESLRKKYPEYQHDQYILFGGQTSFRLDKVKVVPWEFVV